MLKSAARDGKLCVFTLVCLLSGMSIDAQEESDAEKQAVRAENLAIRTELFAALPAAKPLDEELSEPCSDVPRLRSDSREIMDRLKPR